MTSELILADTTIWVHFLRGSGVKFQERLVPLLLSDRLVTTPVIIMEILRGAKSSKEYDKLDRDLAALRCLEITAKVWERSYRLAFTLRQHGINVPLTDTLIAATTQEYKTRLLHDDRHYTMIATASTLHHELFQPDPQ